MGGVKGASPGRLEALFLPVARFLAPDIEISLKLVFDNIRNYIICGGLLAIVAASKSRESDLPRAFGISGLVILGSVGYTLLLLNLCQSFVLAVRSLLLVVDAINSSREPVKPWVAALLLILMLTGDVRAALLFGSECARGMEAHAVARVAAGGTGKHWTAHTANSYAC